MQKHTIDAKDRAPGRVATEAAVILMGKDRTDFSRNTIPPVTVEVTSTSQMRFDQNKLRDKGYVTHSGFPGSLKTLSQEHILKTKGAGEILRRAIYGMLPKNKLRPRMMKNLIIKD